MVRKKQANLERFAGSMAMLVGGTAPKSRAGQRIGKPKFQLDRKRERNLKKEAKKEKKIKHVLIKAGATLPEEDTKKGDAKIKQKTSTKKEKKVNVQPVNSRDTLTSLQSKVKKIYENSSGTTTMSKEAAAIANKQEDKLIKHIGKRLGLAKTDAPKSLDVDGLGYVLHFKDDVKGASLQKNKDKAESAANDLFSGLDSDTEEQDAFSDSDGEMDEEAMGDDFGSDQDIMDTEDLSNDDEANPESETEDVMDEAPKQSIPESIEDVYDGITNKSADVKDTTIVAPVTPTAYVPPHLRNMDANSMLKRKIRGYVNRVSTSNFKQILTDIEMVYAEHPRAEVNKAILAAVIDSCLINTVMPARLCAEHMLLISGLAGNIGPEFVSPLLEDLAEKFANEMIARHGKLLNNIVSMLCFLYALRVVSCVLIFDIIRTLLKSFTEADLEVLLYIFKSVGLDIRKDDPQALKDIVQIVNESGANVKEKTSRFTWFMDTLTAVKNNNVNKIPNYDKSDILDIQRAYKACVKVAPCNLQLTMTDLLDAKTKGRWWLVGAAWTGLDAEKRPNAAEFDSKLLLLAKKNHMSTDVRKNVFCILMSSQDFEHCYEQLMKLSLKDKQEREIIYVTVLCALKCKTYNPYYANVIKKFCGLSKNYQITTQFSVWDRLKELDSLAPKKRNNLSMLLCSLICSKTISLSVLKIVDFTGIGNNDVEFFKDMFKSLLNESEVLITEIFGRLQPLPLDSLKNGIKVFIKHFLKPELSPSEVKNMKIACKCF